MLDIDELSGLEEILRNELNDHLEEILIRLNREEKLEDFLQLLHMQNIIGSTHDDERSHNGKIVVIGQSDVGVDKLVAVAKNLGIEKDRFEFYLDYYDAKSFDFRKIQWSSNYSCILVGPMPHSGKSKGDYSSVIAAIESEEGYPPVIRMGMDVLRITKTSFRRTLEMVLQNNIIE